MGIGEELGSGCDELTDVDVEDEDKGVLLEELADEVFVELELVVGAGAGAGSTTVTVGAACVTLTVSVCVFSSIMVVHAGDGGAVDPPSTLTIE